MHIIHHGAKTGVTGSCHQLTTENGKLLIDCGLFQGDEVRALEIDFDVQDIDALILTHAHIDHIGRLPWLLAAGFTSPIYCTSATASLVPLMLDDALRLQLGLNHKERQRILRLIQSLIVPVHYGTWHSIKRQSHPVADIRFQPAGHILGSAYVEVTLPTGERLVFSGDLGPSHTPLLPDPVSPERADILVIESTYGDGIHESIEARAQRLKALINRSLLDGGVILIPAFSVGRTQELLFDIEAIIATQLNEAEKQAWSTLPVVLDSPMAAKVTEQYRTFKALWGEEAKWRVEAGRHPLAFEQCITIDSHQDHQALVNRLKQTGEPAIVVAASGMCNGGRILNYLEALLPDARTDVILAGYQARGTLGRQLQQGLSQVEIDNQCIEVNAHIHTMSGYSAHADQADLLAFIQGIPTRPKEVRIVHGDHDAQEALANEIGKRGLAERVVMGKER
ncbi:MBL fold metallo-hydrolase [Grimontia hollisae]|uniref:Metallo-beta-lactamase family protein RNA-specific n=1 Tax=Grimontia hollisae CIP 101886 TaxID=675812 RepID=D0IC12_GRIHO|nr:MBL fold metallo-hydrolase [Grimontia hollisae]AMG29803.1 MBL fold metallo-hydrolase [Grimontia hollisae]EEY71430.1 metallo-beta-lactamase family protein RNA-specific [Grimontia hollisae CIP 101886]STO43323.1 Ribonuclease TTHA0252 [Grimontia hollisae]STQ74752.1 Ribonuclease TTHA0252 [Grimontia hollisae]